MNQRDGVDRPEDSSGDGGVPDRAQRSEGRGRLRLVLAAVLAAEAVILALVLWLLRDASTLPSLPALDGQPRALVEHLRQAHSNARSSPRSAEAVGALAMAYHSDGSQAEAAACYRLAQELDPQDWRWSYYEALLLDEMGETSSLLSALRRAMALNPHHGSGSFWLGQAELKLDDLDSAEAMFHQAARSGEETLPSSLPPSEPRSRTLPVRAYASLGLGQIELRRGKPERAREILEQLTKAQPGFGQAHRLLGMALERLGERDAAERETSIARALPPYHPPADPMVDALARQSCSSAFLLRLMGVATKGRDQRWAEYLGRRALMVNPDDVDAMFQLGQFYYKLNRWADALPLMRRFCELSDDRDLVLRVRNNMGVALLRTGKLQEARTCLEAALPGNPKPEGVHLNLAIVLMFQGKVDDAGRHIQEALRIDPDYGEAHGTLGLLYKQTRRLEESRQSLERAVSLNPLYADAWVNLAEVCQLEGKHQEAVRHYRSALEHVPDSVALLRSYAWLLATCGDDRVRQGQEAVNLARRACQLTGNSDLASIEALAAALAEAGDYDNAVRAIERALALAAASGHQATVGRLESRRSLYRSGRPYRQAME